MQCHRRVALVTGASGDIGAAIAWHLHKAGVAVALGCYRHPERAEALAQRIRSEGGQAQVFGADLVHPDEAVRLVREVEVAFGRLDILVNNAGVAMDRLLLDTTAAEWDRLMALHLRAPFLCVKAALPGMLQRQYGRIINIASMWGQVGAANEVAYSTAKAGVIGFTKALAKEVGSAGVTVNAVAPGVIVTQMLSSFDEADLEALREATPVGRLGRPDDVARIVVFLAADESDFINGQVIGANGGMVV